MAQFNPDYDDQPRIDSEAVCKIIRSCITEEQLTITTGMIKLWSTKHKYDWIMNRDTKMKVLYTQMELSYEDTFERILHEKYSQMAADLTASFTKRVEE